MDEPLCSDVRRPVPECGVQAHLSEKKKGQSHVGVFAAWRKVKEDTGEAANASYLGVSGGCIMGIMKFFIFFNCS